MYEIATIQYTFIDAIPSDGSIVSFLCLVLMCIFFSFLSVRRIGIFLVTAITKVCLILFMPLAILKFYALSFHVINTLITLTYIFFSHSKLSVQ